MQPTLRDGDVLVVRVGVQPTPSALVVVHLPGRPGLSVKRVVREDEDGWWVERDNPREGIDSWVVGAIPREDVVAQVVVRVWPPRRIGRPAQL